MLPLDKLALNTGQIDGVPENPRYITKKRYNLLKDSIKRHPEMMGYRELWVFPFKEEYVIIGGNMRYQALRELGYTHAPCKVLPEDTSAEELRHFILLDNAEFGENNTDILTGSFTDEELEMAGIAIVLDIDEDEDEDEDEGEKVSKKCQKCEYYQRCMEEDNYG